MLRNGAPSGMMFRGPLGIFAVIFLQLFVSSVHAQERIADPCAVKELKKSPVQGFKVYAPDGIRYIINKEDEKGIAQIYVGAENDPKLDCITCTQRPQGPRPDRFKMQPRWHPSGRWIFLAVERDHYSPPPFLGWNRDYVEGQLQCGIWTNMYVVSPDGRRWHRMTDFKSGVRGTADGYTGPALTADGKKAVWSQAMDGNIFAYWPFGRWELVMADFDDSTGKPVFSNVKNITPPGMHWNEPGNFHPDNVTLLITGSIEKDAQGMDQYLLNIASGELKNLNSSPTVWDEHGVFSPDGKKIIFMSAYPYRSDPKASKTLSIKTEYMLMNTDGSQMVQLTRFREPGSPEYHAGIAASGEWRPDGRGAHLRSLVFPNYVDWDLTFEGACGNS